MAIKYERPGRFNLVTFILLAIALAGAYAAVRFGPVYYRRWKAVAVVSETANKLYAGRQRYGNDSEGRTRLRQETLEHLREIGIDESTVQVSLWPTTTSARVEVTYQEVVRHPLVNKATRLVFNLVEDVKPTE